MHTKLTRWLARNHHNSLTERLPILIGEHPLALTKASGTAIQFKYHGFQIWKCFWFLCKSCILFLSGECCYLYSTLHSYIILNLQQQSPWVDDGTANRHQLQSPVRAITNLPGPGIMACHPHHQTKASLTVTGVASFWHCLLHCSRKRVLFSQCEKAVNKWVVLGLYELADAHNKASHKVQSLWFEIGVCFQFLLFFCKLP